MSLFRRLIHHDVAATADRTTAAREPEVAEREATVNTAIQTAQAAHHEAAQAIDRMGRLLEQARIEAEALGAPPMRDKRIRVPRPRPVVTRRTSCAASS